MGIATYEEKLALICKDFGVADVYELAQLHLKHDQDSVHKEIYDIESTLLIHNKIKEALVSIDLSQLSADERRVIKSILWLWYHHATTIAIWQKGDLPLARKLCDTALSYLYPEHPNRITPMLCMLLHGKIDESRMWVSKEVGANERAYAEYLLLEFERGVFTENPRRK
jgi:hypothetical protein